MIALLTIVLFGQTAATIDKRTQALSELQGHTGPAHFGVVRDGLYRGGQPNARHLQLLRDLGVDTVIDLRHGNTDAEAAEAQRLGMRLVRFPFYGIFGVDSGFLGRVVGAIAHGGRVYVHCRIGRDRTSLVIALYRVLVDKWDPGAAWQHEAVDYGYTISLWYGRIVQSYWTAVRTLAGRS
jgi:protein tyrosine/serine phosphatase